jgi:hypothetical protein
MTKDKGVGVGVGWFLFGVWRLARYKMQVGCGVIASYCGVRCFGQFCFLDKLCI